MGWFSHLVHTVTHTITHTVSSVVHAVTHTVKHIVNKAVDLVKKALPYVLPAVAAVGLGLSAMAAFPLTSTLASIGITSTSVLSTAAAVEASISSIAASYGSFLTAIHFKTLMTVSEIAMTVSASYRERMINVYRRISDVSRALGYTPEFINLALRNARALVLDASTALGRRYDLAEIDWYRSFSDFTQTFVKKVNTYKNNPSALFDDLDMMIIRPALDVKGQAHAALLNTIDATIKTLEKTVNQTIKVRDDLERFVSDLPSSIRNYVKPRLTSVLRTFDNFIRQDYGPTMHKIDELISSLSNRQVKHDMAIHDVYRRLMRPGSLLRNVDYLTGPDRVVQEDMINEVATRTYRREVAAMARESRGVREHLASIREALQAKIPIPKWEVKEAEAPVFPPMGEVEPRKTWFVGDY